MRKFLIILLAFSPIIVLAQTASPSTTVSGTASGTGIASPGIIIAPGPTSAPSMPVFPPCPFSEIQNMGTGSTGTDVQNLQKVLSEDSSIYPQKLVTGYYGPLTQSAVKNLQDKIGLPQTGVADDATRAILFPCNQQLTITVPNGGEEWKTGQIYQIQWTVNDLPIPEPMFRVQGESNPSAPTIMPSPYYSDLSIDLLKDGDLYYHIGSVSAYGADRSFQWTVPDFIPSSNDYKIRISSGRNVLPMGMKEMMTPSASGSTGGGSVTPGVPRYPDIWHGWLFDESDNFFSIVGGPQPTPNPELTAKLQSLQDQINSVAAEIQNLSQAVLQIQETLKQILQSQI